MFCFPNRGLRELNPLSSHNLCVDIRGVARIFQRGDHSRDTIRGSPTIYGLYRCSPSCISGLSRIIAAWRPILTKDKSRWRKYFTKKQILKKWTFQQWLLRPRCHGVFATWILKVVCSKKGLPRGGHGHPKTPPPPSYAPGYASEWDEIWKKQFSRVLSHNLLLGKQNKQAKEVYSTMGFSENDCHGDGSKLSNVTSFMILRYEKDLTSFNRNNRANNFGEKSKMKLSGFVYCFRKREKNLY